MLPILRLFLLVVKLMNMDVVNPYIVFIMVSVYMMNVQMIPIYMKETLINEKTRFVNFVKCLTTMIHVEGVITRRVGLDLIRFLISCDQNVLIPRNIMVVVYSK
ncbi:MAG: hypothetical protein CMG46_02230, partial [Candidatus Marinimicrobia bacterium]|nr:hypothetical protein [Candidatus Neomarinimicrobiota bacterium]